MSVILWHPIDEDSIENRRPVDDGLAELAAWWHDLAEKDLEMLLPKALEYSAHDLELTGEIMTTIMAERPDGRADVEPAELTCWFYLLSKVMRAIGAIKEGHRPSEDTITDIRVYSTMIARIRATGGWPS